MLDLRTIVFNTVLIDAVSTFVLFLLWRQTRRRFAGISFWLADFALQTLALLLVALRGSIPDWLSIIIATCMVAGGMWLGLLGLQRLHGLGGRHWHNAVFLAAFAAAQLWFTYAVPSLAHRDLDIALAFIFYFGQYIRQHFRLPPRLRPANRGITVVFALYFAVNLARVAVFFIHPDTGSDYFKAGAFDLWVMVAYQLLFVLLTFTLVLHVNRRLLAAAAASEEKYAKAFHSSPYAMALSNLETGRFMEVNPSFLRMTGYRYDEVVGRTALELGVWNRPQDRADMLAELQSAGQVAMREHRFRDKAGGLRIGLLTTELITCDGDACLLSSIDDITRLRQDEAVLRETTQYLEKLLDYANAPIIVWNPDFLITRFNRAFERLTGFAAAEMLGKRLDVLFPPESRLAALELISHTAAGEQLETREIDIRDRSGAISILLWNTANIHDGDGRLLATIAQGHNITKRKQAELEITQLLAEKEIILREVHHRIKNNMNTVYGLLLIQADASGDPAARAVLRQAAGRIQSMMVLYDRLYRLQLTGRIPLREYLPDLAAQVIAIFPAAPPVRLETAVDDTELSAQTVAALGMFVNEVITNAMKYAFRNHPDPCIRVEAGTAGTRCRLAIADNGPGLPEELGPDGGGFGLQLVRLLAEQVRGTVSFGRSAGAEIVLEFPAEGPSVT